MLKIQLGKRLFRLRLFALFFTGFCFTSAVAGVVHVEFSSSYTLPPGITQVVPALRFRNPGPVFSHLVTGVVLPPSGKQTQDVFLPENTDFLSPGVEMRSNTGNIYFVYCPEQVPYSLRYTKLYVLLKAIKTDPYSVTCRIQIERSKA